MEGFGGALVFTPGFIIVGQYFNKKKGKAMGFSSLGSGIGGICFPLIIKLLNDSYSYYGTMLVLGAIMLNCSVIGAVYIPYRQIKPKQRFENKAVPRATYSKRDHSTESTKLLSGKEDRVVKVKTNPSDVASHSTHMSPGCENPSEDISNGDKSNKNSKTLDYRILLERNFILYALCVSFQSIALQIFNTFVVAYARERGIGDSQAVILPSLNGFTDMLGRILSGFIFDLLPRDAYGPIWVCSCALGTAIVLFIIPAAVDFTSLALLSVLLGFTASLGSAQRVTALSGIVQPSRLSSATGFLICFAGIGQLIGPTVAGYTIICSITFQSCNILDYNPYRAFGGQNRIVYSTRFVTRRAMILLLPGNNM